MPFSPKQGEGRKENCRQKEKHSLAELGESGCALKSSQSWCLLCSESLLNKSKRFHPCLPADGIRSGPKGQPLCRLGNNLRSCPAREEGLGQSDFLSFRTMNWKTPRERGCEEPELKLKGCVKRSFEEEWGPRGCWGVQIMRKAEKLQF